MCDRGLRGLFNKQAHDGNKGLFNDESDPDNHYTICDCGAHYNPQPHKAEENGKCACGKEMQAHTHSDVPVNGYYDGICDDCGEIIDNIWDFDEATGIINKYNGTYAKVTIPSSIKGHAVTSLLGDNNGTKGFSKNATITDVIIPESITSIASYSFYGCSELEGVCILAKTSTIPTGVFQNCKKIKWIVLSETITSINNNAFGITTAMATSVLESVYYMGNAEQWTSITFGGTAAKILTSDKVLYYNGGENGSDTEWHWQVEGVIPQRGPWES